jgi:prevent-host-death family protein
MSRGRHGRHAAAESNGAGADLASAAQAKGTTVGIRELARNVSGIVAEVTRTGLPAVVTKHGQPVAVVMPIQDADLGDDVLARATSYVAELDEHESHGSGPSARFADQLARLAEALRRQDPQTQPAP